MVPEDLIRGLQEHGFVALFLAIAEDGRVIGSAALDCVSVQRASRPGGVFGDHIVIDPEYRAGFLAGLLMHAIQKESLALGYLRIDAHVQLDNERALQIYRRIGFRKVTTKPCEDGGVLFENYLPLAVAYLREAGFSDPDVAAGLNDPGAWFRLLPGRRVSNDVEDSISWLGADAICYELRLRDEERVVLFVDRAIDAITAVGGDQVEFACWPEGGRWFSLNDEVRIECRVRNTGEAEEQVKVYAAGSDELLLECTLQPDEEAHAAYSPRVATIGDHVVVLILRVVGGCREDQRTHTVKTWFSTFESGLDHPHIVRRFIKRDRGWQMATGSSSFGLAASTGAMCVSLDDRPVAHELWPDIGPPFPGGFKSPIPRSIEESYEEGEGESLTLNSSASQWVSQHAILNVEALKRGIKNLGIQRKFTCVEDGILRIDTTVWLKGSGSTGERWLRTWPRTLLRDGSLVVPGGESARFQIRATPYLSTNFEFVRSAETVDLAAQCTEPWAAFVGNGEVTGLVFPGSTEVRFGGHWMPSVLYAIPDLTPQEPRYCLPPYLLVVGRGGPEVVADAWEAAAQSWPAEFVGAKRIVDLTHEA
jgi:L-amino acid N-acyltransferase YncA